MSVMAAQGGHGWAFQCELCTTLSPRKKCFWEPGRYGMRAVQRHDDDDQHRVALSQWAGCDMGGGPTGPVSATALTAVEFNRSVIKKYLLGDGGGDFRAKNEGAFRCLEIDEQEGTVVGRTESMICTKDFIKPNEYVGSPQTLQHRIGLWYAAKDKEPAHALGITRTSRRHR